MLDSGPVLTSIRFWASTSPPRFDSWPILTSVRFCGHCLPVLDYGPVITSVRFLGQYLPVLESGQVLTNIWPLVLWPGRITYFIVLCIDEPWRITMVADQTGIILSMKYINKWTPIDVHDFIIELFTKIKCLLNQWQHISLIRPLLANLRIRLFHENWNQG